MTLLALATKPRPAKAALFLVMFAWAHAVVTVADGDVAGALKILKRRLDDTGLLRLLRPNSTLLAYYSKGRSAD